MATRIESVDVMKFEKMFVVDVWSLIKEPIRVSRYASLVKPLSEEESEELLEVPLSEEESEELLEGLLIEEPLLELPLLDELGLSAAPVI